MHAAETLELLTLSNIETVPMVTSLVAPEDTNRRVSRELQSVKPYKTQDEYLYAMKEDLSEWFNSLYGLEISADNFFEQLDTGIVLCCHAQLTRQYIIGEHVPSGEHNSGSKSTSDNPQIQSKQVNSVTYTINAKPGTFHSRDNISNFISWCRHSLRVPETLLFETDDLVLRKNERNVILCILEASRRGVKFGMPAPVLIQLEQEIEEEIKADKITANNANDGKPNEEKPELQKYAPAVIEKPVIIVDMMSLDEMVREILSRCTCPNQFPMIRISEGRYRIGDSLTQIFIRILRNHVMVRIGGGWDTLENYLDRHDPCQCQNKGHKGSSSQRRPSRSALTTSSLLSMSNSSDFSLSSEPESTLAIKQRTDSPSSQQKLNGNIVDRPRSSSRARNTVNRTPISSPLNTLEIRSKLRRSSTLPASSVRPLVPTQLAVSTDNQTEYTPANEYTSRDVETDSNNYTSRSFNNSKIILDSPTSPSSPSTSSRDSLIANPLSRQQLKTSPNSLRRNSINAVNVVSQRNSRLSLRPDTSNTSQLTHTSQIKNQNLNLAQSGSNQIITKKKKVPTATLR